MLLLRRSLSFAERSPSIGSHAISASSKTDDRAYPREKSPGEAPAANVQERAEGRNPSNCLKTTSSLVAPPIPQPHPGFGQAVPEGRRILRADHCRSEAVTCPALLAEVHLRLVDGPDRARNRVACRMWLSPRAPSLLSSKSAPMGAGGMSPTSTAGSPILLAGVRKASSRKSGEV